jgi:hypothetical protein
MNGPGHYVEAEKSAAHAGYLLTSEEPDRRERAALWIALAQVHATLASTAAITLGSSPTEARAWAEVAGTKLAGRIM